MKIKVLNPYSHHKNSIGIRVFQEWKNSRTTNIIPVVTLVFVKIPARCFINALVSRGFYN